MFELGEIYITKGIKDIIEKNPMLQVTLDILLVIYKNGNWGDICFEDKKINDNSLKNDRILAAYELGNNKIWIITEHDRSMTTILLPEEY